MPDTFSNNRIPTYRDDLDAAKAQCWIAEMESKGREVPEGIVREYNGRMIPGDIQRYLGMSPRYTTTKKETVNNG